MKLLSLAFVLMGGFLIMFYASVQAQTEQSKEKLTALRNIYYVYVGQMTDDDAQRVAEFRQSGDQKDITAVSGMIAAIKNPKHPGCLSEAMHSLAKIGGNDALTALEAYEDVGGSEGNLAKVAKARLLAEGDSVDANGSSEQTTVRVHRFFNELGLTAESLNAGVAKYYGPQTRFSRLRNSNQQYRGPSSTTSVEMFALRELADMVFHGSYADYMTLPEVAQTNFNADFPSALKLRLAAIPEEQRLNIIVQELADKKVLTSEDDYEIQLAINGGAATNRVIDTQLQRMKIQTGKKNAAGYAALFRVLGGIGDPVQAQTVAKYLHDPDRDVSYLAQQVYDGLKAGLKTQYAPGY